MIFISGVAPRDLYQLKPSAAVPVGSETSAGADPPPQVLDLTPKSPICNKVVACSAPQEHSAD
jgi:hypothetical protein